MQRLLELSLVFLGQETLKLLLAHLLLLSLLGTLGLHVHPRSSSTLLVHFLVFIHELLLELIVLGRAVIELSRLLEVLPFLLAANDVRSSSLQLRFHALQLTDLLLLEVLNLLLNSKLVLLALPYVILLSLTLMETHMRV